MFTALLFWPGFLAGHYSGYEPFEPPSRQQWMFLVANGLLGTVLSELLWMWWVCCRAGAVMSEGSVTWASLLRCLGEAQPVRSHCHIKCYLLPDRL